MSLYPQPGTITGINLTVFRENARNTPGIFENDFYDALHEVCRLLFGANSVTADATGKIFIRSKITLELSLSWNGPKVYVYSYILPADIEKDLPYEVRRANYSFRFFALEEITNYLLIKQQENIFITLNEG